MRFLKRWQFWAVVIAFIVVIAIVYSFFGRSEGLENRNITQVIADAQAGDIDEIVVG